jgi:hypothetical protein
LLVLLLALRLSPQEESQYIDGLQSPKMKGKSSELRCAIVVSSNCNKRGRGICAHLRPQSLLGRLLNRSDLSQIVAFREKVAHICIFEEPCCTGKVITELSL